MSLEPDGTPLVECDNPRCWCHEQVAFLNRPKVENSEETLKFKNDAK